LSSKRGIGQIVNIDDFYNGSHWSVERWWTREEKIELGIEEEKNTTTLDEFAAKVGDLSNTLLEYQDMIQGLQKKNDVLGFRPVSITDDECFDILSAFYLGLTNKELEQLPAGTIPVYSAAKGPIAYIQEQQVPPIVASIEKPILSFANDGDGSAGRNFVLHTEPFYVRAKRYAFSPKHDDISLKYIWYSLLDIKKRFGFSRTFIANRKNLSAVTIDIPVDGNGCFLKSEQNIIAEQFSMLNAMREELQQKHYELDDCAITATLDGYTMRDYPLEVILAPIKGKSKYTTKYGETNKGEYPVYSASANRPLTHIDTYDFCGSYLSWSTNGFAGTVSVLTDRFSINGDRGILLPKRKDVDIQYLRYILQPLFRRLAKGRIGDRGADEFTKLYPSMIADVRVSLPVDENGEISLAAQQEIAAIYATVEEYKREVLGKISALITQKVEL